MNIYSMGALFQIGTKPFKYFTWQTKHVFQLCHYMMLLAQWSKLIASDPSALHAFHYVVVSLNKWYCYYYAPSWQPGMFRNGMVPFCNQYGFKTVCPFSNHVATKCRAVIHKFSILLASYQAKWYVVMKILLNRNYIKNIYRDI